MAGEDPVPCSKVGVSLGRRRCRPQPGEPPRAGVGTRTLLSQGGGAGKVAQDLQLYSGRNTNYRDKKAAFYKKNQIKLEMVFSFCCQPKFSKIIDEGPKHNRYDFKKQEL